MIKDTTNKFLDYVNEKPVDGGEFNEQGILNVVMSFFDLFRCLYVETHDTEIIEGKKYYKYINGKYIRVSNPVASELSTYFEESSEKEVVLFKQYLPVAKIYCARLFDWSFLISSSSFEKSDAYNAEEVSDSEAELMKDYAYIEKVNEDGVSKNIAYRMYKNFKFAFNLPENFLKMKYINGNQNLGFAVKGNLFYCNCENPNIDFVSSEPERIPLDYGYLIAYRLAVELSQHLNPNGDSATKASSLFQACFSTLQANDSLNYRIQNPEENYYLSQYSNYWKGKGVLAK